MIDSWLGQTTCPGFFQRGMMRIRIDLTALPEQARAQGISDGAGNMLQHGAVAELDDETARIFIARNFGYPLDGSSRVEAIEKAKIEHMNRQAVDRKAAAVASMRGHDDLPEEVRQAVYEHGQDVADQYMASQVVGDPVEIPLMGGDAGEVMERAERKRRGRPPKKRDLL